MHAATLAVLGAMLVSCSDATGPAAGSSATAKAPLIVSATSSSDPQSLSAPLRQELLYQLRARGGPWPGTAWDPRVLEVLGEVPRHHYAPGVSLQDAYRDIPQPIGFEQTISQPTVVAMMTQALELSGREKVLEVGTGSGYQAAVLSRLAKQVYSIELVLPLAETARERLQTEGRTNVEVRAGDGYLGWPEQAPFDRVIVTAAPEALPQTLLDQLAVGGILIAPVGPLGQLQRLLRYQKEAEGKITRQDLGGVYFVPMVKKVD